MAIPNNLLQTVTTYQMSGLAFLQNLNCFIGTANTKFNEFDKLANNLGSTVNFDLTPRFNFTNSLVAAFQPADQRALPLTVNQQGSVSFAFNASQIIFNVKDYMVKFGKGAIMELGSKVEINVAQNCVTNTFRFFGDGVTPINSYQQLAQALMFFRNFGQVQHDTKGYIADSAVPGIVNSGLNQFTLDRGNREANSWELGKFSNSDWYQSNLLPVHVAGDVGINGDTLTISAINPLGAPADGSITSLSFTGASALNDPNALLTYDKAQFQDNVAGQPNMRFMTFIGGAVSQNPVQFQIIGGPYASDGAGAIANVQIFPPLQAGTTISNNAQFINNQVVVGMQIKVLPSHRSGMITAGNPLFLAMPQLPDQVPYPTANAYDPDTGVSIRQTYGSVFGQNTYGMIYDCIWGSTLVPEMSMALIFPL